MIQKISVFGAGTMGHGLAETFAMNGYPVRIYDVSEVARTVSYTHLTLPTILRV